MKLFYTFTISILITILSLFVLRIFPEGHNKEVNSFRNLDILNITPFVINEWENIRGFPLPMISRPYDHNSSSIEEINFIYNFIFYFILIQLINIWIQYKKILLWK